MGLKGISSIVATINEWVGRAVSFLVLAMIATITYDVFARYLFNQPTIWSQDVNNYMLCIYSLLGGGFTLLRGGHVKVDIIYGRLGYRKRAILDSIFSFFFFIFIGVLLIYGWKMAHDALVQKELSPSLIKFPLFPTKVMVPLGAFLVFIQGIVKFINDLIIALTGRQILEVKERGIFAVKD
jgi:TRAP-type mannitol/chloroaromatic compound transport system permease small subunit